jgi:hypothetical protein
VNAQRELERLLEEAREEGRVAGRSEKAAKLADSESTAVLLGYLAEAMDKLSKRTTATGRSALEEAAAVLRDGEKTVRDSMKPPSRKKKSD